MMEVFVSPTPNALKILIMLEEIGAAYQTTQVNIWKGEQFEESFKKRNPNSKVPVLIDDDGPQGRPFMVFESAAILIYLAEKTGQLLPQAGEARSEAFQWLAFQTAGLGPMSGQFNHFAMFAKEEAYSRSRYTTEVRRLYKVIDARLAEVPFLAGSAFSIADIATYGWIAPQSKRWRQAFPFLDIANPEHPHLRRWVEACHARPGVARGEAVFDAIPSQLATASSDELDRVFGRGAYAYRPEDPQTPGA